MTLPGIAQRLNMVRPAPWRICRAGTKINKHALTRDPYAGL
jgi:hypothetical protein